jgi:hypothetical protein
MRRSTKASSRESKLSILQNQISAEERLCGALSSIVQNKRPATALVSSQLMLGATYLKNLPADRKLPKAEELHIVVGW